MVTPMTGGTIITAIILLIAGTVGLVVWQTTTLPNSLLSQTVSDITNTVEEALPEQLASLQKQIITPPPLRGPRGGQGGTLTIAGVFSETNRHRTAENVPALTRNATLDAAAAAKLQDMITQQYFDHVSPDGRGPADVAETAGYRYLRVGENLALGNFGSDAALVQAWMDSPGHRANILSAAFTEIGIAVGQGVYEGESTWLAVQSFGTPEAACAQPDAALQKTIAVKTETIENQRAQLIALEARLAQLTDEIETLAQEAKTLADQGSTLITQGNAEIERGNEVYRETGSEEQARPHWEKGEQLQAQGRALIDEAQSTQASARTKQETREEIRGQHNSLADEVNALNADIAALVKQYNGQVQAFNTCLESFS